MKSRMKNYMILGDKTKLPRILFSLIFIAFTSLASTSAFSQSEKIENYKEQTNSLEQTVNILARLSAGNDLDDNALVGARVKFKNITTDAAELIRTLDNETTILAQKLTEIGTPPEDGVTERFDVTQTRKKLNQEKSALAVSKTDLEDVQEIAKVKIADIDVRRQTAFTKAIFKKTNLTNFLFTTAASSFKNKASQTINLFSDWLTFIFKNQAWSAVGSTFMSLLMALVLSFYFNRIFSKHLERSEEQPDYFTKVFTAFWDTTLSSLATAIFLGASFALFVYFDLFTPQVQQITLTLISVITSIVFAWNLVSAIFAPSQSNWRLLAISDSAAKKMFALTFLLFLVQAADYLVQEINVVLSGPISITAVQGLIAALIIGGALIAMALVSPWQTNLSKADVTDSVDAAHSANAIHSAESAHSIHWPKWLSIPLILIGGAIIISAFSGYIGLARFIAQQVVVTGAIISLMIIGIISARELSREGILPNTTFGKFLSNKMGYETLSIEQISLVISVLLIICILIVGIPAILLQWGTHLEEIWYFAKSAFTGVQIGNVRLSLSGILFGVLVLVVGITITKLIQSWLSKSVFPRSRADIGVRDSIKSGFGYFGYGLSALLGVTTAGVDLSNLAIVFGALSLGIGFGLQNIVNNFVSGLILLVERPIKVGDWITVGAAEGTVMSISVRATEIETFQRKSIIVPNSELINQQVGNWTLKSKSGRVDVPLGVAYGSDVRLVEKILYEIADEHSMVAQIPEVNVWFAGFGDSSLDFILRMHLYDIGNNVTVQTDVRFEILKRFEELNIEIPFPQRDINIKYDDKATSLTPLQKAVAGPKRTRRKEQPDTPSSMED